MPGVFSLVGIVAGVFSIVYVIEEPDYLAKLPTHESQVFVGAFFQLLMVPAYVGVALSLYPILKNYNERLALGFVGFRFVAAGFHLVGVIILPLFVYLGREALIGRPGRIDLPPTSGRTIEDNAGSFKSCWNDPGRHFWWLNVLLPLVSGTTRPSMVVELGFCWNRIHDDSKCACLAQGCRSRVNGVHSHERAIGPE